MPRIRVAKAASGQSLLVELLTEELPPNLLKQLSFAFAHALSDYLRDGGFIGPKDEPEEFATPRRLAVLIPNVRARQLDSVIERKGPSVQAALDPSGKPTPALLGFARSCGAEPAKLERRKDEKGEYFLCRLKKKGEPLTAHLAGYVEQAIRRLPVAKLMRWSARDIQFARPVHGLIMLHGSKIVPGEVLGLKSGNKTRGHRFMSSSPITIKRATDYAKTLRTRGKVIAGYDERLALIVRGLDKAVAKLGAGATWRLGREMGLVDEVTSIVESPSVHVGTFDPAFLEVPRECLIVAMQQHQKYFPVADVRGKLLPRFLFVANMQPRDPSEIVHGNERVLRARLADAKFFYDQDRKTRLADRVPRLAHVVYHSKLGSQLERVQRLQKIATHIARAVGADPDDTERAAHLAKADLLTEMVGEFPELQGVMGGYYASDDGEKESVTKAIANQYRLRFDETSDPENLVSASLYLADRLEALVGFFGIGVTPTGDKDPYGLRRAALGALSVYDLLVASTRIGDRELPDVRDLIVFAAEQFKRGTLSDTVVEQLHEFMLDRYWHNLVTVYPKTSVDAVISKRPRIAEVSARVRAVQTFRSLPEAQSLSAANKRIRNILRKSDSLNGSFDEALLVEPAERELYQALRGAEPQVATQISAKDYTAALRTLASLRETIDGFFDKVLVNADDVRIRTNRHALLKRLDELMNQVADISRLAA